MATDLHVRATEQRDALELTAAAIAQALQDARAELSSRHPDPASVTDRSLWRASFGAAQHGDVANAALADARDQERQLRLALSEIVIPADAPPLEVQLRANLVDQADLQVELRGARERKVSIEAQIEAIAAVHARAEASLRSAEDAVTWGKEHQDLADGLVAAINTAPLVTVGADAGALGSGPEFTAADDRLDDLLPGDLRTRASERFDESQDLLAEAVEHSATGRASVDSLDTTALPFETAIQQAERAYLAQEATLVHYVNSAAQRIEAASTTFAELAALADLPVSQADAIDAANNPDGVAAITDEGVLAAALVAERGPQQAVDDAVVAALISDPDSDPMADADVQLAVDALNANAIQDPIAAARIDYDDAARAALSEWEIEVPPALWLALGDFKRVDRDLTQLDAMGSATDVGESLTDLQNPLADALTARDVAVRTRLRVDLELAARTGDLAAAERTAQDRHVQYLRGDGPSGRTSTEL